MSVLTRRELVLGWWRGPASPARRPRQARNEPQHVAQIQPWLCLAHRGQGCAACGEHCPLPGAVLRAQGLPQIDPAVCDGCGRCAHVCPAPLSAILLAPRKTP